jgi:integrase
MRGLVRWQPARAADGAPDRPEPDLLLCDGGDGQVAAAGITADDISRYLSMRSAPIRANREIATMSSIFKHGQRTQQVSANPTHGVPRNAETPRDHIPTDDDFAAVRAHAPDIIALGMDFAFLTGMRLGDMLRLPIPRDPDGIHFRANKTGQALSVEWDDALDDLVKRILALRKVTGMTLFANRRGQPYTVNGWESMWQRTLRKAEMKGAKRFRWQDMRALAATTANRSGQDSQALLGHKSERQHLTYLRSRAPLRAKPVQKLDT